MVRDWARTCLDHARRVPRCWNAADSSMIMFWCYKWHRTWHYLINTLPGTTLSSLNTRATVIQIYATRYLAHRDYRALAPGRFASLWCDLFHLFRLRYKIWFVWDEDTDQSCLSLSKPAARPVILFFHSRASASYFAATLSPETMGPFDEIWSEWRGVKCWPALINTFPGSGPDN